MNPVQTKMALNYITPKKNFLTGLKNQGQVPFINPVIQCLFYTKSLSNHFKIYYINPNLKLAFSFQKLIKQLSGKNTENFYPINFINTIKQIENKKNINIINANNGIYDFLKFILNQLHQELKDDIINQNGFKSTKFGTKREYNEFNYENEKSIITELFQIESTKI